MKDSRPEETFGHAIRELDRMGIVYLHLVEGGAADARHGGAVVPTELFRPQFPRALIVNGSDDENAAVA